MSMFLGVSTYVMCSENGKASVVLRQQSEREQV